MLNSSRHGSVDSYFFFFFFYLRPANGSSTVESPFFFLFLRSQPTIRSGTISFDDSFIDDEFPLQFSLIFNSISSRLLKLLSN